MSKFKVGDKVLCVNGNRDVTEGETYDVVLTESDDFCCVKTDRYPEGAGCFDYRFVLVEESKFKVGDKVVITKDSSWHDLYVGSYYNLEAKASRDFGYDCWTIRNEDGIVRYITEDDFRKVEHTPLSPDNITIITGPEFQPDPAGPQKGKSDGGPSEYYEELGGVQVPDFPLIYFPNTGTFVWQKDIGKKKQGSLAGSLNKSLNYWTIRYNGKLYYSHRLAFLAMKGKYPEGVVDHIDRDGSNNIWVNLRDIQKRLNHFNTGKSKANKSGCKGVYQESRSGKWITKVSDLFISYSDSYDEAVEKLELWAGESTLKGIYNVAI